MYFNGILKKIASFIYMSSLFLLLLGGGALLTSNGFQKATDLEPTFLFANALVILSSSQLSSSFTSVSW